MRDCVVRQLVECGLDPAGVEDVVARALAEDLAGGVDATSVATVPVDLSGVAEIVAREPGVLAGLPVAIAVLEVVADGAVTVGPLVPEGTVVSAGTGLVAAHGLVRSLLTAERTALNLLGHLSGIATLTRTWVDAVAGTGARIRDTRKTTPGLRFLEKYAVRCGGGLNHRMSLCDAALVKDNHVLAAGGVGPAFTAVRSSFADLPVEVECDTLDQVEEALAAGANLILLDNFSVAALRRAVALTAGRCGLEASGGLSLDTARAVAETGVDYLSVGALTHSAPVLDIAMDLHTGPTGDAAHR